jgi:ribosome maturation factor RimP
MKDTLLALLERSLEAIDLTLWGYEWTSGAGARILRVYVDHAAGVSIDTCVQASKQINAILAAEAAIEGAYNLEVSSPGIGRVLFFPHQFEAYIGAEVCCRLREKVQDMRRVQGALKAVTETGVKLQLKPSDGGVQAVHDVIDVAFANIDKANLVE